MRTLTFAFLMFCLPGLADGGVADASMDAGAADAAADAGLDAGVPDASVDAGGDAGLDAGLDAGSPDAASDAGLDAGEPDAQGAVDAGPGDDAGSDAGGADAGGCVPQCDGNVLVYCDSLTGAEVTLDCVALGGRCGLLDVDWGEDCLLGEGEACDPDYAGGVSRCDNAGGLCCDGEDYVCQAGGCADEPEPTVGANAGGIGSVTETNDHPLSCIGCQGDFPPSFGASLLAVWLLSGRRRRRLASMLSRSDRGQEDA